MPRSCVELRLAQKRSASKFSGGATGLLDIAQIATQHPRVKASATFDGRYLYASHLITMVRRFMNGEVANAPKKWAQEQFDRGCYVGC
jgi:hypothetical protein